MSGFASTNDLAEKTISFDELGPGLYGYTAEGDPNSGIVVGDNEGVVVIPAHIANEVAEEAHEMTAFEDFVMERVQAGETIVGLYPPTQEKNVAAFAAWRKAKGR